MSGLIKNILLINKRNSPFLYLSTAQLEYSKKMSRDKKCFHEFYNNDQQPNKMRSPGAKIGS